MPAAVRTLPIRLLFCLSIAWAPLGCREEASSARRTWTPADHSQPPQRRFDQGGPPQAAPEAPAEGEDPVARAAATLYMLRCASCHGREGRGGGPDLPPGAQPPDFTATAWQEGIADEAIAVVIRGGRNMMPAFAEEIPPAGIEALVGHLRRLGGR